MTVKWDECHKIFENIDEIFEHTEADNCINVISDHSEPVCIWKQYGGAESDRWETGCDNAFSLFVGTPSTNDMRFCPFCGRPLIEQPYDTEKTKE